MSVRDDSGTFKVFHANKNGANTGFSWSIYFTINDRELAQKIEAYREKHNMSRKDFWPMAAKALVEGSNS